MDNINDELKLYRGGNFNVTEGLFIRQPVVGEIEEIGEEKYYSGISKLIATPNEMIYPLSQMGIDFTTISEFDLFVLTFSLVDNDVVKMLMPNIDFSTGKIYSRPKISASGKQMKAEELFIEFDNKVEITEKTYLTMMNYIRKINHIPKTWWKTVGTESTKKRLIRSAKAHFLEQQKFPKPFQSILLPLISSLVNSGESKADWNNVWDMRLGVFFDSVERIQAHENSINLYAGIYNGCVDEDKVKKYLDWMRRLD